MQERSSLASLGRGDYAGDALGILPVAAPPMSLWSLGQAAAQFAAQQPKPTKPDYAAPDAVKVPPANSVAPQAVMAAQVPLPVAARRSSDFAIANLPSEFASDRPAPRPRMTREKLRGIVDDALVKTAQKWAGRQPDAKFQVMFSEGAGEQLANAVEAAGSDGTEVWRGFARLLDIADAEQSSRSEALVEDRATKALGDAWQRWQRGQFRQQFNVLLLDPPCRSLLAAIAVRPIGSVEARIIAARLATAGIIFDAPVVEGARSPVSARLYVKKIAGQEPSDGKNSNIAAISNRPMTKFGAAFDAARAWLQGWQRAYGD